MGTMMLMFSHVQANCDSPSGWSTGSCNSVYGGFRVIIHQNSHNRNRPLTSTANLQGNSNNLHRIIVDDFTDSMTYLLMVSPIKLKTSSIIFVIIVTTTNPYTACHRHLTSTRTWSTGPASVNFSWNTATRCGPEGRCR